MPVINQKQTFELVILVVLCLILISVPGCKPADQVIVIPRSPTKSPSIKPADCLFDVPQGYDVECMYVTVPEDRSQPDGPSINLPVAVFKSTNPEPAPDPVVHLYGGPGGSLLDNVDFYLQAGGDDILKSRDYVLFNQRGTRYAEPFLDCPGSFELFWETAQMDLSITEREAADLEFLLACHQDLVDQGINLAAYNSTENAADIKDLSAALGYDQVNLYGVSYGARLVLNVMRDHPQIVRSAIIDSGYPMEIYISTEFALSAARAFDLIFNSCAADPVCQNNYPDLERTFYRVIDELNTNPVPFSLNQGTVLINGYDIMNLTFGSLYTFYGSDGVSFIPWMITIADEGNLNELKPSFEIMFSESTTSQGMYYSIICREEVPPNSYQAAHELAADLPSQIQENYVSKVLFTLCESWTSGQVDPAEKKPVVSNLPTLVLTGQYDPITPPPYNKQVADSLSNSYFFEIPGIGHGAMRGDECALEIALQFLDDPGSEPDASCLQE
jgi:pimeloyl-ACP methyl ester carboxylesterase